MVNREEILRNLKIEELNPMQQAACRAYEEPKDMVLLSPTGSGKTLAFLLPLVQKLKDEIKVYRLWYWCLRASWHCRRKTFLSR